MIILSKYISNCYLTIFSSDHLEHRRRQPTRNDSRPASQVHSQTSEGSTRGRSPERSTPVQAHVLRARTASQRRRRHLSRRTQHALLQVCFEKAVGFL